MKYFLCENLPKLTKILFKILNGMYRKYTKEIDLKRTHIFVSIYIGLL